MNEFEHFDATPRKMTGMKRRMMGRASIAAIVLAILGATLLVGGMGAASASAAVETSANESVLWSNSDGTAHLTFGRNQRCPSGWVCLYEHSFFNRNASGRMLMFREDRWQQLSASGFNDKTSSWRNHTGRNACLSKNWPAGRPWLTLSPGSSAQMGSWNDEASGVRAGRCRR